MAAKPISLPEPKRRPAEVNKTNDPKYCPYHRIISHPKKDCHVFKDIIKDMIKWREIEKEGALPKGPTASSNAASMFEQRMTLPHRPQKLMKGFQRFYDHFMWPPSNLLLTMV